MHADLKEAVDARVMYLDMNSFFASVEQQINPALRGIPMAVISHLTNNGTVLAASYEAKAFGIRTGTKVKEARILCPQIKFTDTTPGAYKATHLQFVGILKDIFGPEVQVRSIDEVAMFMPPNWRTSEIARSIAVRIKERFAEELGPYLKCSIGIAPNSLLAKVATDLQKPDGLTEITLANLAEILGRLDLTDLPGISYRNTARLNARGIMSVLDLYNTSADHLKALFGIWGYQWWFRLHGLEADSTWSQGRIKMMSHEHVLTKWVSTHAELIPLVDTMADRLIHRLRHNSLQTRFMGLSIRLVGYPAFERSCHLDAPTASYPLLLERFRGLLHEVPAHLPVPARKISVWFGNLTEAEENFQMDLFDTLPRQEAISQAVENLRDRYGFEAVRLGSVFLAKQKLKQEIGFGQLKDTV